MVYYLKSQASGCQGVGGGYKRRYLLMKTHRKQAKWKRGSFTIKNKQEREQEQEEHGIMQYLRHGMRKAGTREACPDSLITYALLQGVVWSLQSHVVTLKTSKKKKEKKKKKYIDDSLIRVKHHVCNVHALNTQQLC